jgi:y4mF family transcriptional regulator
MKEKLTPLSKHIKMKRKQNRLTQPDLALKAGVGLRFVRDLEQGKTTLRMDKVNDVLRLFGETLGPVALDRDLWLSGNE